MHGLQSILDTCSYGRNLLEYWYQRELEYSSTEQSSENVLETWLRSIDVCGTQVYNEVLGLKLQSSLSNSIVGPGISVENIH